MNWYKISQENNQNIEFSGDLISDIEDLIPDLNVKQILEHYNIDYDEFEFPKYDYGQMDPIIVFDYNSETYVVENFSSNYPNFDKANDWIWRISDNNLHMYFDPIPKEAEFWEGVRDGFVVYHGTTMKNLNKIRIEGLIPMSLTRGLTNKYTPPAVFTSLDPIQTESYGDVLITIDVGKMKKDGYMPRVNIEEPIEDSELRQRLANLIGLKDFYDESYSSDGISPDTLIFFGKIPPKYLNFSKY